MLPNVPESANELLRRFDPIAAVDKPPFRIEDIPSVWDCEASTNWIIDQLIPDAAVTLLCGDSGVGKSTFTLALACAVAHGTAFLGRTTVQRPVVYVDRENPLAVVRQRLDRLSAARTSDLTIWGPWVQPPPEGPTAASVIEFASKNRPLIIFDALVAFHPGSEQDASETRKHMQSYISLAAAGAAVIILHHTGKADTAKQYRGSSDIKAAVDVAYTLESLGEPDQGIGSLRLKQFKNRLSLPETLCFDYHNGRFEVSGGAPETGRETLEQIISKHPEASKSDIEKLASEAGLSQKRTRTLLGDGERDGWLTSTTGPRGRQTYRLAGVEIGVI